MHNTKTGPAGMNFWRCSQMTTYNQKRNDTEEQWKQKKTFADGSMGWKWGEWKYMIRKSNSLGSN